jgi:predicted nucleotidyltransferase
MLKIIEGRKKEQKKRFDIACLYVQRLASHIGALTAILYGSSVKGDFKDWSDIDIIIISDRLPSDPMERLDVLYEPTEGLIEPKGFTRDEFKAIQNKPFGHLLITEAMVIRDDLNLFGQLRKDLGHD